MNITEAKKLCRDNGIHQLNKGESLADALEHIQNGTARKGYKFKHDNGSFLTENQIIQHENKEAFKKSFTPAEYSRDEVESIDDIVDEDDFREDKNSRGVIANCYYCGTCIRIDSDTDEDYEVKEPEVHCNDCMNDAIMNLAM